MQFNSSLKSQMQATETAEAQKKSRYAAHQAYAVTPIVAANDFYP